MIFFLFFWLVPLLGLTTRQVVNRLSLPVLMLQDWLRPTFPPCQTKDNMRSSNLVGLAALAATHPFQLTSFRRTQSKRCWHQEIHTREPSHVTVTLH